MNCYNVAKMLKADPDLMVARYVGKDTKAFLFNQKTMLRSEPFADSKVKTILKYLESYKSKNVARTYFKTDKGLLVGTSLI